MARRLARRASVEILYAADLRDASARLLLEERRMAEPLPDYTDVLVWGVDDRRTELDALLTSHAKSWPPERMSVVDRNVLRVAVLELLLGDVPAAVVIDEAVELAKSWSGPDAGRFVNGVLSGVLRARAAPG